MGRFCVAAMPHADRARVSHTSLVAITDGEGADDGVAPRDGVPVLDAGVEDGVAAGDADGT